MFKLPLEIGMMMVLPSYLTWWKEMSTIKYLKGLLPIGFINFKLVTIMYTTF